jgi:hypothetical protein
MHYILVIFTTLLVSLRYHSALLTSSPWDTSRELAKAEMLEPERKRASQLIPQTRQEVMGTIF